MACGHQGPRPPHILPAGKQHGARKVCLPASASKERRDTMRVWGRPLLVLMEQGGDALRPHSLPPPSLVLAMRCGGGLCRSFAYPPAPAVGPPRPWCDTPSIRLQYASIKESELSPSDHPTVFPMCPSCPLPQFRSRSTLPVCFSAPRARPPPPASNYDRLVGEGPRRVPRRPAPGPCSRFRMPAPCLTACPPSPTQRPHTHPMAAQPTDPSTLSPPRASALPSFHCLAVFSGPL